MAAAKPNNQRSWKNFLLNKRYQLRFTLFMTGLSALLMGLLGWWVKSEAGKATEIAINNVYGSADLMDCERPDLGDFGVRPPAAATGDDASGDSDRDGVPGDGDGSATARGEDRVGEPFDDDPAARTLAPGGDSHGAAAYDSANPDDLGDALVEGAEDDAPRIVLDEIEGEIEAAPSAPAASREEVAAYYECRMEQSIELAGLVGPIYRGERQITAALVIVGLLLLLGITLYGIVMTHRVAGPLYKISLYLDKLRDGRYDTVYNLRKGDQLVEFYEQFKRAHAGLRTMQEEDVARLRDVVALADREGLADRSPELAEAIEEMRDLVAEKENSLG